MTSANIFITNNAVQTRKLGEIMAEELRGGEIICLSGELGSGKTTFSQGLLRALGARGPYTSPTFVVMKQYKLKVQNSKRKTTAQSLKPKNIYHIDAYRISADDIINLGWGEIVVDKNNVVVVEWAEKIKPIIPKRAVWIEFEHSEGNKRKITIKMSN